MYHTKLDDRRWTMDDGRQTIVGGRRSAVGGRQSPVFNLQSLIFSLLLLVALAGCSPKMSYQAMAAQPRHEPLEPSEFFKDGQSSRQLVPNTVARGFVPDDPVLYTGKVTSGDGRATNTDTFPIQITRETLERGRERYNIYCTPCHDAAGTGNGVVVKRGFTPPPSLHIDRLRESPVGHYFDVMTNGWGAMPSYAHQIPVRDRWAITAYIRALQLSQNARVTDLTAEERTKLEAGGR